MNLRSFTSAPIRHDVDAASRSAPPPAIGRRRILVADDEPGVRHVTAVLLTRAGFEVDAAADGEQAWQALIAGHYDLLVTDHEMPRLRGLELVKRLRDAGMNLAVIIASGTLSMERLREHPQLDIAAVLLKPFSNPDLLAAVGQCLTHDLKPLIG